MSCVNTLVPNRFTAYRVSTSNQNRSGHVKNLTLAQVRDETRFPLGLQKDSRGENFIWAYGLNDGELI